MGYVCLLCTGNIGAPRPKKDFRGVGMVSTPAYYENRLRHEGESLKKKIASLQFWKIGYLGGIPKSLKKPYDTIYYEANLSHWHLPELLIR